MKNLKAKTFIEIIWPEQRRVDSDTVRTWYDDAVANGYIPRRMPQPSVWGMARALHHVGLITLTKGPSG